MKACSPTRSSPPRRRSSSAEQEGADQLDPYERFALDYHWLVDDVELAIGSMSVGARAELARLPKGSRVLDAACGIGVDALVLARKGHRVTATDASPAMIALARQRFADSGAEIPAVRCGWHELADRLADPFDAVLCTGNALAHLAPGKQVETALGGLRAVLVEGGVLLVDGHRWDVVDTVGHETQVADPVTRDGETAVCRCRWRRPSRPDDPRELEIEISVTSPGRPPRVRTHVVSLWPHTEDELRGWLRAAGFPEVRVELDAGGDRYTVIARAG